MKNFLLLIALSVTAHSFAQEKVLEFDDALELRCHKELKSLGCVSSSGEQVDACAQEMKTKMSAECASLNAEKSALK